MKRIIKEEKSDPVEDSSKKEDYSQGMMNILTEELHEHREILRQSSAINAKFSLRANQTLEECLDTLKDICKLNEEIEATMCNIMLAIKQNSFLQAWYPEQQGIKEGHFAGPHPIIQERINEKYSDSDKRKSRSPTETQTHPES